MKITLNNIELARGDTHKESPVDFKINEKRSIQVASFLRGEAIKTFDRGNSETRIDFKVIRHHPSIDDACNFFLSHTATTHMLHGTLYVFKEDSPNSYKVDNACVLQVKSTIKGMATEHEYSIIGGKISPKEA